MIRTISVMLLIFGGIAFQANNVADAIYVSVVAVWIDGLDARRGRG